MKLQKFASYDIEAANWVNYVIGAITISDQFGNLQTIFYKTPAEMIRGMIRISETEGIKLFYAHNGGKYDTMFLINEITEMDYFCDVIEISGRIIEFKVMFEDNEKRKKMLFCLRDSYALFQTSLDKISSELIGEKKKTDLIDYNNVSDTPLIREYLKQDTEILYKCLKVYFEFTGFVCITQPSAAMKIYSEQFEKFGIFEHRRSNEYISEILEKWYYGGRVEIFKNQAKNIYYYDVNSLYPGVMKNNFYPIGEIERIYTDYYDPDKLGLYEIEILSKTNFKVSPIPVRTKEGIYYVNCSPGDIVNITSLELNYLIKKKVKFKVLKGYVFSGKEKIFTDYVDYFFKKKIESKENKILYKFFLNTLYGKFGMNKRRYIIRNYTRNEKKPEMNQIRYINESWIEQPTEVFSNKVLPEVAVFVTSYARMFMLKFYEEYFDALIYTDTDSILISRVMDKKYIDPVKLGLFKFEGFYNKGVFLQSKTYALKNKEIEYIKFKGFHADNFTYADFEKCIKNGKLLSENQFRLTNLLRSKKFERIEVKKVIRKTRSKRDQKNNVSYQMKEVK